MDLQQCTQPLALINYRQLNMLIIPSKVACDDNSSWRSINECQQRQGNRRYDTSPTLCTTSPPSRPIGRMACAQNFPDFYMRLPIIVNNPFCCMMLLATEWSLLQRTRYNALSLERKTPKIAPSPWDFVTLPEEDRATAIGNMHRKIGKHRARVVQERKRTDRQTCSSQYFANAPAGEVIQETHHENEMR